MAQQTMPPFPDSLVAIARDHMRPRKPSVWRILFVLVIIGQFMWGCVGCAVIRHEVAAQIRLTPEYRCLAGPADKNVYIRWNSLTESRSARMSIPIGTIFERVAGSSCIPDGDAVTFAFMPDGSGSARSLVRIKGVGAKEVMRGPNRWYDVTDASGSERWRNDGDGYRRIDP